MFSNLFSRLGLASLNRLIPELSCHRGRIVGILLLGLVIAAIQPACVRLTQQIIDSLKEGVGPGVLNRVAGILIGLFLLSGFAKYFHNTMRRYVSESVVVEIRNRLFEKYLRLPLRFLDSKRTGDLLSNLQNDLAQISTGMDTLCDILREPFTFIGLIGVAFYCDWQLTTATLVVTPLVALLFSRSGLAVKRYSERNLGQFSDLMSLGQEALAGTRVVKVFRMEGALGEKFRQIHRNFFGTLWKSIKVQELNTPLVEFIGALLMAGVIAYGGARVASGYLTAGELVAFIIAIGLCQMPIKKLNNAYLKLKMAEAALDRVFGLLEQPAESTATSAERPLPRLRQGVRFENVSLRYGDKVALDDVSFEVPSGEVIALVGPSGSGKTSLVNLLPRLYPLTQGRILFDGKDIRDYELGALRGMMAFVTQDTFLFNDTLYENIRSGRPGASEKEVKRAAALAHCEDFIERCSQGYQTPIGDRGVCLSGGERQRLAIARAILKDAPLLVLDEATSSLDSHSERVVQKALESLMEGRTTFLVAHRFSTIRKADRILVLDKGRIAESGSHQHLLRSDGIYRELYQHQDLSSHSLEGDSSSGSEPVGISGRSEPSTRTT